MESIKQFGGNMGTFNTGDKVVCIDASNSGNVLEEGKIYTVEVNSWLGLLFLEYVEWYWEFNRFELYKENPSES